MLNIYDISKKTGVSIATVSRVLNGSSHVSEKTRERVLSVIKEEGYTPNAFARGLGLKTMFTVGILYSDASDLFLANAIYYLEQGCRALGYDSLLCCSGYSLTDHERYTRWMLGKKVDAIVLAGSHFVSECPEDNAYILDAARQVPVAVLGAHIEGENVCCAYCDDRAAAFELTQALIARGTRRPLFLYNILSVSAQNKLLGIQQACAVAGLPFTSQEAIRSPGTDLESCGRAIRELRQSRQFDTILCMDDMLAAGVLKSAQAAGIAVPDELRIAGYNNSILARYCTPELTTVENFPQRLCAALVEMLAQCLSGDPAPAPFVLNGRVILGQTG